MKKTGIIICLSLLLANCSARKKNNNTTTTAPKKEVKSSTPKTKNKTVPKTTPTSIYSNTTDYINAFKNTAIKQMKIHNIPASITLAQGILESASGNGRLAVNGNNHFGIKCHNWNGDKIYHDDDLAQECFRKYKNAEESYNDHSLFLKKKRYANLFNLNITNYRAWARGLKAAGYATDPTYHLKLISLIERFNLNQFDSKTKTNTSSQPSNTRYKAVKNEYHTVAKGDTLYSISKFYNVSIAELKHFNNLNNNTIKLGQKLIINKK